MPLCSELNWSNILNSTLQVLISMSSFPKWRCRWARSCEGKWRKAIIKLSNNVKSRRSILQRQCASRHISTFKKKVEWKKHVVSVLSLYFFRHPLEKTQLDFSLSRTYLQVTSITYTFDHSVARVMERYSKLFASLFAVNLMITSQREVRFHYTILFSGQLMIL